MGLASCMGQISGLAWVAEKSVGSIQTTSCFKNKLMFSFC